MLTLTLQDRNRWSFFYIYYIELQKCVYIDLNIGILYVYRTEVAALSNKVMPVTFPLTLGSLTVYWQQI